MNAIFKLGNLASAEDIRGHLANPPSDSSVRVMLARLEKKGVLKHQQGRSAEALRLARANAQANNLPPADWIEGDVFRELRSLRDANRRFDLIVLDPPKFAPTAAHAEKAARAYKDINLLAFKLLRPAGLLVTFSCSGGVSADLFQKIVAGAALDAGVWAQIVERLGPGTDHPVALNFPEGDYLKGLVCRVGDKM